MPDPRTPFSRRTSSPDGVGPFTFDVPALGPGEFEVYDLRELNGGEYVSLSPAGFDSLRVENSNDSAYLRVRINETRDLSVPPNTVQTFDMKGMYRFDVYNQSGTASTAADEVEIAVSKSAYGADDQARSRRSESPLRGVLRNFTGL